MTVCSLRTAAERAQRVLQITNQKKKIKTKGITKQEGVGFEGQDKNPK